MEMNQIFNVYLGKRVHKAMADFNDKIAYTQCGKDVDINDLGGNIDITLEGLNHNLCRKCFG